MANYVLLSALTIFSIILIGTGPAALAGEAELQAQIDKLIRQNEVQAQEIEKIQAQSKDLADRSSKGASTDTSVSGYGEIHYNDYEDDPSRRQMDMHRFVIFLGHRFDERLSFNGEIEFEHAVTSADDQGETEVEQAFLSYQIAPTLKLKTGLFLMPFGVLNEAHEPPVFYGVERNEVETRIIPSTWREGGVGLAGETEMGFSWELGVVSGFNIATFNSPSKPLGIRQQLQLAKAHDLNYYGVVNYRLPGFLFGGGLLTGDSTQGNANFKANSSLPDFSGIKGRITLADVHTRWQSHGWDLQALFAKGSIAEAAEINQLLAAYNTANPGAGRAYVPAEFYGWLAQAAYVVWERGPVSLAPFARYEDLNTQSKMPEGFSADPKQADRVTTVGLSFKPHPQAVFKADVQKYHEQTKNNRLNVGMGYMF